MIRRLQASEGRDNLRTPFVEYSTVSGSDPLRQGDVLEAVDSNSPKWRRHLFVVTADCDLAYQKHHGRVTCVPILASTDYLLEMHIPKLCERLRRKPLHDFRQRIANTRGASVTDERLVEWIEETAPEVVVEALELTGPAADAALRSLTALRLISGRWQSLQAATSDLVQAQLSSNDPPPRAKAIKTVQEALRSVFNQSPGDALFLSAFAPEHEEGYFAYLRHLEQVWEPEIATTLGRTSAKYRRISRLQDRFTHAIVQRFAMVFMPIGLPTEYEELRTLHSELVAEELA